VNLREIAEDQNKKEDFRFKALDLLLAVFQRKHISQNFFVDYVWADTLICWSHCLNTNWTDNEWTGLPNIKSSVNQLSSAEDFYHILCIVLV